MNSMRAETGASRLLRRNIRMPTPVPALQRAAAILGLLSDSPNGLTLGEIRERLELPKSTAHNLCWTLVQTGLASRDERGTFRVGLAAVRHADAFARQDERVREFEAALAADADLPSAHWLLSLLQHDHVLVIAARTLGTPGGPIFTPGLRWPALCAASGKAILATRSIEEIRRLHGGRRPIQLTRASLASVDSFLPQRETIRARGYAEAIDEVHEGVMYFAAPVFDGSGRASAGISVSLPSNRPSLAEQRRASSALLRLAAALSRRLGAAEGSSLVRPPGVRAAVRAHP